MESTLPYQVQIRPKVPFISAAVFKEKLPLGRVIDLIDKITLRAKAFKFGGDIQQVMQRGHVMNGIPHVTRIDGQGYVRQKKLPNLIGIVTESVT
jgi:hypothetical protein